LAALTGEGIIERRPYSATRHEFVLTDAGRELWPSVYALTQWGERHRCAGGGARRLWLHAACGTELDDEGACPACRVRPVPEEVETRPGPGRDRPMRDDAVSAALREPHRLLTPLRAARPASSRAA
jgi:HxlR-like helix-turn-helix